MELTIEQSLQQGIAAHKEGKLQDAERLYRAILQSQPTHPDANHNLGIIAVSVNQAEAALPLFKTALEANPKMEQFWLSYLDALIKEKQFENAKQLIEQAKTQGVATEKLNILEAQVESINIEENTDGLSPPQVQLNALLEHYQAARSDDAEKLAISITQEFPQHQFAWKVMGAIFVQAGRNSEAAHANQTAVALSPRDAEAHYNLGVTLQELGRLDEAEASYTQTIVLKPDSAGARNNLGGMLQQLGRLEEAEAVLRQAIALKPDFTDAHYNLGGVLQKQGRLDEAEVSYTQAVALKSDFADAHYNLGATLKELGRLDEAEASYTQAIVLKPDYADVHYNLGVMLQKQGRLEEAEGAFTQAIALKPDHAKAHMSLLRCLYLLDKQSLFFDQLDHLIDQGKVSSMIGSFICRAALKYGEERSNPFCKDPLKYVLHTDLNTQYDFENFFVGTAKAIINEDRISDRKQTPILINGYQTSGNLFDIKNDFTNEIEKAIRFEIEKYRINFKISEEGLIKKWPAEYSLYGWIISMKSGGELKPHIHSQGWLSGSIYINIPPKSKASSGNLVVSVGEEKDAIDTRKNLKKIINVVTGSMVLFPASLTHHTIPFESEEERIVLSFDVKRK